MEEEKLEMEEQLRNKRSLKKLHFKQSNTDDRWFNNPQFRIKIGRKAKLYISLMQQDIKITKGQYVPCNFMVIRTNDKKNRVWERPKEEDILFEAKREVEK